MANTYLSRTETGTASNQTKFTYSAWIKRSKLGTDQTIFYNYKDASNYAYMYFRSSDDIRYFDRVGGGDTAVFVTNNLFRDTSAWYHIVLEVDTTQATSSDRIKFYVNNEQVTFSSSTIPAQDQALSLPRDGTKTVASSNGGSNYFDGSMSHVHFVESTAYDASAFGETDATTGEWVGKTSPSVTYGNTGFFILKDGNGITDQSGEGNDFTLGGGTLTDLKDNPDNVFATINNLVGSNLFGSTVNFSNGNTTVEDPSGSASGVNPYFMSTLAMPSKGKFYCELKPSSFSTGSGHGIGIFRTSSGNTADVTSSSNQIRYIFADTSIYISKYGSTDQSGLTAISSGDIVGMALDLDNGTFQYYVNGVARGSQITGVSSANDGYDYFFFANLESSSSGRYGKYEWNFGNGYFGTTAITTNSGNGYSGAEGSSKFNYTVPTGYSALSTKGLNE